MQPVTTILSGPAGGVTGACMPRSLRESKRPSRSTWAARQRTSALLSGEPRTTSESMVAGMPVAVPMLEIHTVGAGGGSIARFDRGGALRVGPESAGAEPGPICYGRGDAPTVTDAHVVLGHFGGGDCWAGNLRWMRIGRVRGWTSSWGIWLGGKICAGNSVRGRCGDGEGYPRDFGGTRARSA